MLELAGLTLLLIPDRYMVSLFETTGYQYLQKLEVSFSIGSALALYKSTRIRSPLILAGTRKAVTLRPN
jgi:hypothetical protein